MIHFDKRCNQILNKQTVSETLVVVVQIQTFVPYENILLLMVQKNWKSLENV